MTSSDLRQFEPARTDLLHAHIDSVGRQAKESVLIEKSCASGWRGNGFTPTAQTNSASAHRVDVSASDAGWNGRDCRPFSSAAEFGLTRNRAQFLEEGFAHKESPSQTTEAAREQRPLRHGKKKGGRQFEAPASRSDATIKVVRQLERPDVFGSRSLGALSFSKGHALSFLKFFESHTFETRHVEKHVFAASVVDETKTFFRDFFDRAFWHSFVPLI